MSSGDTNSKLTSFSKYRSNHWKKKNNKVKTTAGPFKITHIFINKKYIEEENVKARML